jgi:hypothetical protein
VVLIILACTLGRHQIMGQPGTTPCKEEGLFPAGAGADAAAVGQWV